MSNKAFYRIAASACLKFVLIDNKRHYEWDEVLEAIRKGKNG